MSNYFANIRAAKAEEAEIRCNELATLIKAEMEATSKASAEGFDLLTQIRKEENEKKEQRKVARYLREYERAKLVRQFYELLENPIPFIPTGKDKHQTFASNYAHSTPCYAVFYEDESEVPTLAGILQEMMNQGFEALAEKLYCKHRKDDFYRHTGSMGYSLYSLLPDGSVFGVDRWEGGWNWKLGRKAEGRYVLVEDEEV